MYYVYKYCKNKKIVYIGITKTLSSRISQHRAEEKFKSYLDSDIYYCKVPNYNMADMLESELIRRYKPILNNAKTSNWEGLKFVEPQWKKWKGHGFTSYSGVGRPKVKTEPTKTINIAVPISVLEKINIAKVCYGNNLTEYVNAVIRADLDENMSDYEHMYNFVCSKKAQ